MNALRLLLNALGLLTNALELLLDGQQPAGLLLGAVKSAGVLRGDSWRG